MKLSNEAKVGILVTAAIAALIWGLNYLKGKDLFKARNKYYAVYESVDGLVKSNPIFMNGFRIGIINEITFMPDHSGRLLVSMLIQNDVFVSKNSVARIFSSDLIGTKAMRVDLGNAPEPAADGDTLVGALESSFAEQFGKEVNPIKRKSEHLIENLDSTTSMLQSIFDPNTKDNLRSTIQHLNRTMASVDELVGNDRSKLNVMLDNMNSITGNLKQNNQQITTILRNFSSISDSLAQVQFAGTLSAANSVLHEADSVMKKINNGEGSLGMLVNNRDLYVHLDSTAKALNILIDDLNKHPKRYVHFSVFGKKDN